MRCLLLSVFLLFVLHSSAQLIEISPAQRLANKTSKFKIIGKNQDGYLVRLYGADDDAVQLFSDDLKLSIARNINFKNQDGPIQHIVLNKSGATFFYLSREKKKSFLYAQPVNSKYSESGRAILLDTLVDTEVADNLKSKSSADQNYLLFYYPVFNAHTIESMHLICINKGLQVLSSKHIPLNLPEKNMEYVKALVDNDANCFLIFSSKESTGYLNKYTVFAIAKAGEVVRFEVTVSKPVFGEPQFELDNANNKLVVCGFYDEDSRATEPAATGFFYFKYEPLTGKQEVNNFIPFSQPFMKELTGRDNVAKRLFTFNIKRVILRIDGGAMILAESFLKDTKETALPINPMSPYASFSAKTVYQFNDVIAFSIKNDATIDWSSVLRKKQITEDDNGAYSSFMIMNEKEKLRLQFLDESALKEYVLRSEGKFEQHLLMNQDEKDLLLMPKLGKQTAPNEVLLPSIKGATFQLVKISY